ncbi:GlsB/YeaQ/YmgE family stress response membrane protein [Actinosynnema sp. NPDC051121]
MGIGGVISALIVGLILGLLGKLVAPGKQAIPIWLTIIVGIVAAFIGTFIARALGVEDTPGIDWIEIIVQVIIAAIGVSLVAGFYGKKSVR